MYHVFIINRQVVGQKSDMPYDYLPHMTNSSWLTDQGQTLAHFKNHLKRRFLLTLDRCSSLLLGNNNSQSRSRSTAPTDDVDDGAYSNTKGICCWWTQDIKQRRNIYSYFIFCFFVSGCILLTSTGSDVMDNFYEVFISNWLFLKLNHFICDGTFLEVLIFNKLFLKLNWFNFDGIFSRTPKPQSIISQNQPVHCDL